MKYDLDRCTAVMSVRELCYLTMRHGGLDTRGNADFTDSKGETVTGAQVHSLIQKSRGKDYKSEVKVLNTSLYGDIYYEVSGRADGVFEKNGVLTVEEIKTCSGYELGLPPDRMHMAQLKCYAYFLCREKEIKGINTVLTYYNPESEKERNTERYYECDELRIFYYELLKDVEKWATVEKIRAEEVLPSLENAVFPYAKLRKGQMDFIREAYCTIKRGRRLFAQAPTGTGKTISSIYPAIRAIGNSVCDKVFYLTAKSSTAREAYNAVGKLFSAGAKLKTVVIGAKEQVCICEKAKNSDARVSNFCNSFDCEYANGYYDRVDGAIFELLTRQNGYNLQILREVAKKHRVCPYELSLDISKFCDVVICDYNYLFSPNVYMRRYFSTGAERGKYVFLIDEAHNLPARTRDMYSSELSYLQISNAYATIDKEKDPKLNKAFEDFLMDMYGLRRLCEDSIVKEADGSESGFYMSRNGMYNFSIKLEVFAKACELWLKTNREDPNYNQISTVSSSANEYLRIMDYYDDKFLTYIMMFQGDIKIKLYCLDPSKILDQCMHKGVASVLFSATLTPLDYFTDVLGGGKLADTINLPTPFKKDNLFVAAVDSVSTRYDDRNDKLYRRIMTFIAAAVSAKHGNYIAYFPSYNFMEQVKKCFEKKLPKVKLVVQKRGMSRLDKEKFLNEFKEDTGKLRIGMCVLGGSFSEGVDLPGSKLIGTIIVGVGLPSLSNEGNIIKEYYDLKSDCGYDYAYTFPGMNNVLQAAGRVIRTDSDKGIVILIDDRYAQDKYKLLFPPQWRHLIYTGDASSLAKSVSDFWKKHEK